MNTSHRDTRWSFFGRVYRALLRVIPDLVTQTQAIGFNMFLAFSPMILIVLGAVAESLAFRQAMQGILNQLRVILPPGTFGILTSFLTRHNASPWELVVLGLSGTLLAGTQMMKLIVEGFRLIYREYEKEDVIVKHLRAVLLLSATIVPSIFIVNFIVFGRQVRNWMLHMSSMPVLIRLAWSGIYILATLLVAMFVLSVVYRVGCPGRKDWNFIVPGAGVATVLWWVVSISLGFYLRHVPYSLVYGGLAVTIGLLLWMQLTATILMIGAAYNAELEDSAE